MKISSSIIDTLEEAALLARLKSTALEKVRSITSEELKQSLLDALSKPGAYAESPVAIANRVIREERKRLTEQTEDRDKLKEMVKDLYDNQAWRVSRVARTEASNAAWLSYLTGYREQGIEKFVFHSHTYEAGTCSLCLALDGTEHSVDDWLSAGRYPLSSHTHPQCRCWPSPVISHVTLESMEELYENREDLFAPGQSVFDSYQLEQEDIVKSQKTIHGTEIQDMPVEHEQEIRDALGVIKDTPYQQYQPTQLRFVKDVGADDTFKEAVPTPEPLLGSVTAWTSPDNELLVSKFAPGGGNQMSATIIREWAGRVYDENKSLQEASQELYERDEVQPADLSPKTIQKLLKTFEPWTMMRTVLIDGKETVALEKRLRDAPEKQLVTVLDSLGISNDDVDTIVKWRSDRPVFDMDGNYVPQREPTGSAHNRFVNRVAEQGPREMFCEAAVAFVSDPWGLYGRDPDLYGELKEKVFDGKEFKEG